MRSSHYTDVKEIFLCFESMTYLYLNCFVIKLIKRKKNTIKVKAKSKTISV